MFSLQQSNVISSVTLGAYENELDLNILYFCFSSGWADAFFQEYLHLPCVVTRCLRFRG